MTVRNRKSLAASMLGVDAHADANRPVNAINRPLVLGAAVRSNSIERDTVDHPITLNSQRHRRTLFAVVATVLLTLAVLSQAPFEHERTMTTAAENG